MAARQTDIDTIRAMACVALVSFHVVGFDAASGMELPEDHPLHVLQRIFTPLRMPLFTFISGLVFATVLWPGREAAWFADRLRAKMRRLLLPLVTVGSLFWIARYLMGAEQVPFGTHLVQPFAHYWYLQATFLIMATTLGLLWLTRGRVGVTALALAGIGLAGQLWTGFPQLPFFSNAQALWLAPFFAAGLAWRAYVPLWGSDRPGARTLGAILLAFALCGGAALAFGAISGPLVLSLPLGLAGCAGLMLLAPHHAALARLGRASYAIYLFHVFFTAGFLAVVPAIWPAAPLASLWLGGIAAGLVGPMLVQRLCLMHPVTATAFLGLSWRGPTANRSPVLQPL